MTLRLICIASVLHERFYYFYLGVMVVKLNVKVGSVTKTIYIRLSYQRGPNLFNSLEHFLPMRA